MMRSALRIGIVALVATCAFGLAEARASLILVPGSVTDTTTNLSLMLDWTGPAADNVDLATIASLTNWSGLFTIGVNSLGNLAFVAGNLTHVPGGPGVTILGDVPAFPPASITAYAGSAAHAGAFDKYVVTIDRTGLNAAKITITGAHVVPEPSTALLGLAGLGLLAGARVIRRRMS